MTRVGLVLGAGGVTGEAFHRGVLRALHDIAGWDARTADMVMGTSAGSLVAASLRTPDTRPTEDPSAPALPLSEEVPSLAVSALLAAARRPWRARVGVVASSVVPPRGTPTDEVFVPGLDRRFGTAWPERDLWLVAVRRRDGRRVVFGREGAPPASVAQAVAASCALPGVFRPVVIEREAYVDGGAHSPTNADVLAARADDLDTVVVTAPMAVSLRSARPTLDLTLRLLWRRYLVAEVARLRRRGLDVWTFLPGGELLATMGVNPLRADRVDEVEELSYEHACRQVASHLGDRGRLPLAS